MVEESTGREQGEDAERSAAAAEDTADPAEDHAARADETEDSAAPADGSAGPAAPAEAADDGGDRPRRRWHAPVSDLLVLVLCALLGIALVAQVRHTQEDPLATLRQDDLVRLLDELDRRNIDLVEEQDRLEAELDGLRTAADSSQAAAEAAAELAGSQGVLAGTVPAGGPGVVVTVADPDDGMRAQTMVTMIQELRNAGAEAIEVGGVRLTATSYVERASAGMIIDGTVVEPPYVFRAIGDPETMRVALEIPGGALSSARGLGADVSITESDRLEIWSVAEPRELDESRVVQD